MLNDVEAALRVEETRAAVELEAGGERDGRPQRGRRGFFPERGSGRQGAEGDGENVNDRDGDQFFDDDGPGELSGEHRVDLLGVRV